jgi:hypothetical protein
MPAEMPPDRVTMHALPLFHDYSVTGKIWRMNSPERGEKPYNSEGRKNPIRRIHLNQLRRVTSKYPICGSVFRSTDWNGAIAAFCSSGINSEILSLGTTRASSAPPFHS